MERDLDFANDDHGTAGPLPVRRHPAGSLHPLQVAFRESCLAAGFPDDADMNSPRSAGGVGCFPFNVVDGERVTTATSYLAEGRARANLTVLGDAPVRRIVVAGGEAQGVEAVVAGETVRFEAGAVVVSAGSFATPQLLMLSGIGPAATLGAHSIAVVHDLPRVGENLQDHPLVNLVFRSAESAPDDAAPVLQVGLRATAPSSDERLDLHYLPFSPVSAEASQYGFGDEPFVGTNVAVSLRAPRGAGRVSLASADPDADPAIAFRFLDDPWDLARMRAAVRLGIALTERPVYRAQVTARVAPTDETLASDEALDRWLRTQVTAAHASGTCRMGPAQEGAVVDPRCRVHGIGRLWLADASVMPKIVRANTAATATLVAERVAEWWARRRDGRRQRRSARATLRICCRACAAHDKSRASVARGIRGGYAHSSRTVGMRRSYIGTGMRLAALLLFLTGVGCQYADPVQEPVVDPRRRNMPQPGHGILGPGGITLFGSGSESSRSAPSGIGVNSYLWRASLDTTSFMPLLSADPFGGVIITDWYAPPETPDERFKMTVYIRDRSLRADGVQVAVFRQVRVGEGLWEDRPTSDGTAVSLENAILERARQLRTGSRGG